MPNFRYAKYAPDSSTIDDPNKLVELSQAQIAATQALTVASGIPGYPNASLPIYLQIGDSNQGRGYDSIQVTSGNMSILSPGIGQCTLATAFNLPAGMRVRLSLANAAAPEAYYGEKQVLSRVSSTVFTFATGETLQSSSSAASGVCQLLHRGVVQGVASFVRGYLYGRAVVVNAGDGASQTGRNFATLPAILAANPNVKIVDLQTATNDVDAAVDPNITLGNIRAMGILVRSVGALFIVGLVYPKDSSDTDAAKGARIRAINAGLLADMRAGLCAVPDVFSRLVDGTVSFSTAAGRSECMADASHLTMTGAVASFKARKPILDAVFGVNLRGGIPDADTSNGLQNLFTWGYFPDTSGITTAVVAGGTVGLSIEPNTEGLGNNLIITITSIAAETATITFPSATAILTALKKFRQRAQIGVRSTTAPLRNVTVRHTFTSSYQVNPQLLGTNTSTNGATGAGFPTWEPMTFESIFVTPNSGVTSGTANPEIVVTTGGAGITVVTVADWRMFDLGAST
jgi:hypothetical protein